MLVLVVSNLLNVGTDIGAVASLLKVALGKVAQGLAVEGGLEVLEDEGELEEGEALVQMLDRIEDRTHVEDVCIGQTRALSLLDGGSLGRSSCEECKNGGCECGLHC